MIRQTNDVSILFSINIRVILFEHFVHNSVIYFVSMFTAEQFSNSCRHTTHYGCFELTLRMSLHWVLLSSGKININYDSFQGAVGFTSRYHRELTFMCQIRL